MLAYDFALRHKGTIEQVHANKRNVELYFLNAIGINPAAYSKIRSDLEFQKTREQAFSGKMNVTEAAHLLLAHCSLWLVSTIRLTDGTLAQDLQLSNLIGGYEETQLLTVSAHFRLSRQAKPMISLSVWKQISDFFEAAGMTEKSFD